MLSLLLALSGLRRGTRIRSVEGEVPTVGEQRMTLSLDEGAVLGSEAAVARCGGRRRAPRRGAARDAELVEDEHVRVVHRTVSEARKGFHMWCTASWIRAVFWCPAWPAKKRSMSASVRPVPPDPGLAACDRDR